MGETLKELADLYGQPNGDSIEIMHQLTNDELAALVGTTPQTISTLLTSLKRNSIIERRGSKLLIHKLEELASG